MKYCVRPMSLREANAFVDEHHRHHKASRGHKFSICVKDERNIVLGVLIAGRPVARGRDDGLSLEVTRLCTTGTQNVCSMLYGAAARIAKEMGYSRIGTYILDSETGVSLKAAGWKFTHTVKGRPWDGTMANGQKRNNNHPTCDKKHYERVFRED